ncbi:MAG: pantetheine-phosphate adenylyltransferase [Mariprofundaceae bacterium]
MSRSAIYPGTFDPITLGHVDIIKRGLAVFDRIVIGVAENPEKQPSFSLAERLAMVQMGFAEEERVEAQSFSSLLVNFARKQGAHAILRGLRAASDFEYEFQMATMNRRLDAEIETVFVMASEEYTFVSSSLIREIAGMDGDVSALVPDAVLPYLKGANK